MHDVSIDFTVGRKDHTLKIRDIAPTYVMPGYAIERQCQFDLDGVVFDYLYQADDNQSDLSVEPAEDWDGVHENVQEQVIEAVEAAIDEINDRLDNVLEEMLEQWTQDGLDTWRADA